MTLLEKLIGKIKIKWIAILIALIFSVHGLACIIGFFVLPFLNYSAANRIPFLFCWIYTVIATFVMVFEMCRNELKTNQKEIDAYKKDKVVYIVGRSGTSICLMGSFLLAFLVKNDFLSLSVSATIGICVLGLLLFAVLIALLSRYKDNYKKMVKDTFSALRIFFITVFSSLLLCFGLIMYENENVPMQYSRFLIAFGAIVLLLGGLYLVCKTFLSLKMFDERSNGLAKSIMLFLGIGVFGAVIIRYVLVDKTMQEIITSIFASVLGGTITLVGVAWTIKKGDADRQSDLKRLEEERKEEERKKYRPFLNFYDGPYRGNFTIIEAYRWLKETNDISKNKTTEFKYGYKIPDCAFANTDFSNFYVGGIKINDYITSFESIRYAKKGTYFLLNFYDGKIYLKEPLKTISVIVEDMLQNLYELKLEYSFDATTDDVVISGNWPTVFMNNFHSSDFI